MRNKYSEAAWRTARSNSRVRGTYTRACGTGYYGRGGRRGRLFAPGTGTGTGRAAVRSERYIFLNILVTVRNRLVTQPCHLLPALPITYLLLTKYVPGHRRGYAVRFWLPRNPLSFSLFLSFFPSLSRSLSVSVFLSLHLSLFLFFSFLCNYLVPQHASAPFSALAGSEYACERLAASRCVYRAYRITRATSTFPRKKLLLVETFGRKI